MSRNDAILLKESSNTLSWSLQIYKSHWFILGSTFAATRIEVSFGRHALSHIDPNVFFEALMYGRSDRESFALPLGMRLVAQGCVQTTQTEGDGIDNDCDGSVDEELCNSIDDDADGSIDEDCGRKSAFITQSIVV